MPAMDARAALLGRGQRPGWRRRSQPETETWGPLRPIGPQSPNLHSNKVIPGPRPACKPVWSVVGGWVVQAGQRGAPWYAESRPQAAPRGPFLQRPGGQTGWTALQRSTRAVPCGRPTAHKRAPSGPDPPPAPRIPAACVSVCVGTRPQAHFPHTKQQRNEQTSACPGGRPGRAGRQVWGLGAAGEAGGGGSVGLTCAAAAAHVSP